jgi:FKBP-type peptidyl-prolyl cis-trans isomerase (trigger factor)
MGVGASAAFASMWSKITEEELSKITRKKLLDEIIKTTASLTKTKEEQEKTLSFLSKSIPNKNNEFVIWIKQMQEKYDDEKFKEFTDKAMEVISNLSDELMEEPIGSDSTKILPSVNDMGNILLK